MLAIQANLLHMCTYYCCKRFIQNAWAADQFSCCHPKVVSIKTVHLFISMLNSGLGNVLGKHTNLLYIDTYYCCKNVHTTCPGDE